MYSQLFHVTVRSLAGECANSRNTTGNRHRARALRQEDALSNSVLLMKDFRTLDISEAYRSYAPRRQRQMLFGWRQGWIRAESVGVSAMMTA